MNGKNYIAIRKAEELTGLCQNTLRKLADEGILQVYRTSCGQRRFNKDDLEKMCNNLASNKGKSKINYIYTRVSTKKQLDDLQRQVEYTKTRVNEPLDSYRIITDIGSGINFQRKGLQEILDSCVEGVIGEVVVAHRDRLSRFAFDLIEKIIQKSGGKITVLDADHDKSTEQELAEDLLAIVHIYSCRQMGRRKYKTNDEKFKHQVVSNEETTSFSTQSN